MINDTVLTIMVLITCGIVAVGVIGFILTTGRIMREQEDEIADLRKQLAARDRLLEAYREPLDIVSEDFPGVEDVKFGDF